MPVNTIICSECGSRINYVVDRNNDIQSVKCYRCQSINEVEYTHLPTYVLENIQELDQFNKVFSDDVSFLEEGEIDNIEQSLSKADKSFELRKHL